MDRSWPPGARPHERLLLPLQEHAGPGRRRILRAGVPHRPSLPVPAQERAHVVRDVIAERHGREPGAPQPPRPCRGRLPPLHGLGRRARDQVDNGAPGAPLQRQPLVARLGEALLQRVHVGREEAQPFAEHLQERRLICLRVLVSRPVMIGVGHEVGFFLDHGDDPGAEAAEQRRELAAPACADAAERVDAVDGDAGRGAALADVERVEVELGQVARVVHGAEAEGDAHEAGELLHPLADLPHHALHGGGRRGGGGGHVDGGDGEVRRVVGGACGERLEERRPLRAEGVAEVEDVEPLWLRRWRRGGGLEEGLEDGPVGGHVAEGGPRAELLELERDAAGGVEGGVPVRCRGQRPQRARPGRREPGEERLQEVGGQLLLHVPVRRRQLVEHPHELLHARAVPGRHGPRALHQQLARPPPASCATNNRRRRSGRRRDAPSGGRSRGREVEVEVRRERELGWLEQRVPGGRGRRRGQRGRGRRLLLLPPVGTMVAPKVSRGRRRREVLIHVELLLLVLVLLMMLMMILVGVAAAAFFVVRLQVVRLLRLAIVVLLLRLPAGAGAAVVVAVGGGGVVRGRPRAARGGAPGVVRRRLLLLLLLLLGGGLEANQPKQRIHVVSSYGEAEAT